MSTPKQQAIRIALKSAGRTSHLGKKGAPGIEYKELNSKEKYYRGQHDSRVSSRQNRFERTGYGRHLVNKARMRGEE